MRKIDSIHLGNVQNLSKQWRACDGLSASRSDEERTMENVLRFVQDCFTLCNVIIWSILDRLY